MIRLTSSINILKPFIKIKESTPKSDPMYFISKLLMNSLYGRFGMDYKLEQHQFMDNAKLTEILQREEVEVSLPYNMDSDVNLVSYLDKSKYEGLEIDIKHEFNVSIGIASAISAYARVHMSQFKNNPKYTLFYTDTDSIYVSEPLPTNLVSDVALGKLKLEYVFEDAIFLAPKVYAGKLADGSEIIKIKGLTKSTVASDVTFDKLTLLLNKNSSLVFNQIKSFKDSSLGTINLLEQTYNLIPTENKRELVYSKDGKLIATRPYVINKNKTIFLGMDTI